MSGAMGGVCSRKLRTGWRRRESNPGPKTTCSRIYVRSRHFASLPVSPAGGLSRDLVTCLIFAARPVTRRLAIQLGLRPRERRWRALPSDGVQCCLGSERECVIVRNQSYAGFYVGLRATVRSNEFVVSVEADRPLLVGVV